MGSKIKSAEVHVKTQKVLAAICNGAKLEDASSTSLRTGREWLSP